MRKTVWIVEVDHEPLNVRGHLVAFPSDECGTRRMKAYLNRLDKRVPGPYYDAFLYAGPA